MTWTHRRQIEQQAKVELAKPSHQLTAYTMKGCSFVVYMRQNKATLHNNNDNTIRFIVLLLKYKLYNTKLI